MMIYKFSPLVDNIQWLKRLYTQLNEPTNQNALIVPKVAKSTNKKTLWTSAINSPMSPPSLGHWTVNCTDPSSFINTFSRSLAQKLRGQQQF